MKILFSYSQDFKVSHFEDWSFAKNLALHNIYTWQLDFGSSAYKLPGYPLFLWLFIKVFGLGNAIKWIVIVQHIFYFAFPVFLIKTFQCFKLDKAGFLAAYLFILSPSYFYYSNALEATNLLLFLLILWAYQLSIILIKGASWMRLFMISVLSSFIALTQVVAVPVILFLIVIMWKYRKLSYKNIIVILLTSIVMYSPWVIRNYMSFNKIIITKSPVYQNVFTGYKSEFQILPFGSYLSENDEQRILKSISEHDEFEDEIFLKSEVDRIIKRDHLAPYKKALNNFVSLWYVPKKYVDDQTLVVFLGRKLYVIAINILLLWSLFYFLMIRKYMFVLIMMLVFAGFTFPYLMGHASNIRFKLDFEWIQLSVIALFLFYRFFRKRIVAL